MTTNLCFGLACILVLAMPGLLILQSNLALSSQDHTIAEVLIVCTIFWLIAQIIRFDERLYLRRLSQTSYHPSKMRANLVRDDDLKSSPSSPARPHHRDNGRQPDSLETAHPTGKAVHGRRVGFASYKNHRIGKPV